VTVLPRPDRVNEYAPARRHRRGGSRRIPTYLPVRTHDGSQARGGRGEVLALCESSSARPSRSLMDRPAVTKGPIVTAARSAILGYEAY